MSIHNAIATLTRDASLATIGLARRAEQQKLIESIGEALGQAGKAHLLEAETGTGKTFAQLLCAALQSVSTGQRIVIATHSYVLMRDILEREYPRVQSLLLASGMAMPSIGLKLGRQAFVCPPRLAECLREWEASSELTPRQLDAVRALLDWAQDTGNSGIIADFEAQYGPLPTVIRHDDICLTSHRPNTQAYERHRQQPDTGITVVSHAMLLRWAMFGKSINDTEARWVIIDEADAFIEQMRSMQYRRCNLTRWMKRLTPLLGSKGKQALKAVHHELTTLGEQVGHLSFTQRHLDDLKAEVSGYLRPALQADASDSLVGEFLDELDEFINPGRYATAGVGWSEQRHEPALVVLRQGLGRAVWQYLDGQLGTIMMSATLSDSRTLPDGMLWLTWALFIPPERLGLTRAFHPEHFGTVSLTLAGPRYPHPFQVEEDELGIECVNLNEQWITATAEHIASSASHGNTLVITGSFEETRILARQLTKQDAALVLHVHQPGQKLAPLLRHFAEQGGVLLSPSVGLGVNVRHDDGSQLFRQLVITRLSYPPRDLEKEAAEAQYLREQNRPMKDYSFIQAQGNAVRRLRQAFGRAIRQPDDQVTVLILDPRLPVAGETSKTKGLVSGIPLRFHDAHRQATVLCPNSDKAQIKQELIVW